MSANHLSNASIEPFKIWLEKHGVKILPVTHSSQLLRWKGMFEGVVYHGGVGHCTYTKNAIHRFKQGLKWNENWSANIVRKEHRIKKVKKKTKRALSHENNKKKIKLLCRDGNRCFYCDQLLNDDITIEHLIPVSKGGKDNLDNMVLAHQKCNQEAGTMPLSKKVELAIQNRTIDDFSVSFNY